MSIKTILIAVAGLASVAIPSVAQAQYWDRDHRPAYGYSGYRPVYYDRHDWRERDRYDRRRDWEWRRHHDRDWRDDRGRYDYRR